MVSITSELFKPILILNVIVNYLFSYVFKGNKWVYEYLLDLSIKGSTIIH